MTIHEAVSIQLYNTFNVDVKTKFLGHIRSIADAERTVRVLGDHELSPFILGGGSNTLFVNDWTGVIFRIEIKDKQIITEDDNSVTIKVGAGENWAGFVNWSVNQGLSGIENLAYIPGTVGAAPVQNLAAYGQTFEDVLDGVGTIDLATGQHRYFYKDQTEPAYRSSVFKTKYPNRYLITHVTIKLSKQPQFDTHYHGRFRYESLANLLHERKSPPYTPKDIAEIVTQQRQIKLPELSEYGTCGSFFINPFVTIEQYHDLGQQIADLQHYPISKMEYDRLNWHDTQQDQIVKVPAGRLLDELGWKGKWIGNVGTYVKHALIVVTNKQATGQEILDFTNQMQTDVFNAYGIKLQSEVNIVQS